MTGYQQRTKAGQPSTMACGTCGRVMRPQRTSALEAPGTVAAFNTRICQTCKRREYRADQNAERVQRAEEVAQRMPKCPGCSRPVRPETVKAADAPGTVRSHGGRCWRCAREGTRESRADAAAAEQEAEGQALTGLRGTMDSLPGHNDEDPRVRDAAHAATGFIRRIQATRATRRPVVIDTTAIRRTERAKRTTRPRGRGSGQPGPHRGDRPHIAAA